MAIATGEPQTPAARPPVTLSRLWRLAGPTALARAGVLIMALVDVAMLGRVGAEAVAALALGVSLFIPILVTGLGLIQGVLVLSAQAHGRGDRAEALAVYSRGLPWALCVGLAGGGLCMLSPQAFQLLGHDPSLAASAGPVAVALAFGMPGYLIYLTTAFSFEAAERPWAVLITMIVANLANALLNWVLIFGHLGMPEMGALGSAVASSVVRTLMAVVLIAIALATDHLGLRSALIGVARGGARRTWSVWGSGGWSAGLRMRRLGWAAGASTLLESSFFATLTQCAGFLGPTALAAFAVVVNFESIIFMLSMGLASATAVLVGGAFGAGDFADTRRALRLGLSSVLAVTGFAAAATLSLPEGIAALYTSDPELVAAAAAVFIWCGPMLLSDGAQLIAGGAVRALGDGWAASRRYAAAFWGVGMPSAIALCFGVEAIGLPGFGAIGLIGGAFLGSLASFILQSWRFASLVRGYEATPS